MSLLIIISFVSGSFRSFGDMSPKKPFVAYGFFVTENNKTVLVLCAIVTTNATLTCFTEHKPDLIF